MIQFQIFGNCMFYSKGYSTKQTFFLFKMIIVIIYLQGYTFYKDNGETSSIPLHRDACLIT